MCRSHVLAQMQTLLPRFVAPNLSILNSECGVRLPVVSTQLFRRGKRYSFASRKKSFSDDRDVICLMEVNSKSAGKTPRA